jgi:hypothetical protein
MWRMFYCNFGTVHSLTQSENDNLLDKWFFDDRSMFGREKWQGKKWIKKKTNYE